MGGAGATHGGAGSAHCPFTCPERLVRVLGESERIHPEACGASSVPRAGIDAEEPEGSQGQWYGCEPGQAEGWGEGPQPRRGGIRSRIARGASRPGEGWCLRQRTGSAVAELTSVRERGAGMFLGIFIVLLVAWLFGWAAFHVAGGLIHLLLIVAVISLVVHFVRGRPA